MKFRSIFVTAALVAAGCAPAVRDGQRSVGDDRADQPTVTERELIESYTAGKGGGRTFLDTLNRGKEVGLDASDLSVIEVEGATAKPTIYAPGTGFTELPADAAVPRFRIQILASSQVDMVRREKLSVETKTTMPVTISSEQSLYKLYIGDFKTRADAEAELAGVKRLGYADAWVVSTK